MNQKQIREKINFAKLKIFAFFIQFISIGSNLTETQLNK